MTREGLPASADAPGTGARRPSTAASGRPATPETLGDPWHHGTSGPPAAPGGFGGPGSHGTPGGLGAPSAPAAPGGPGARAGSGLRDGSGARDGSAVRDGSGARSGSGSRGVPAARTSSASRSPSPSASPRPAIQRASVRGQILDALRAALVAGELAPGEVYSAPALGESFGVSATPVREAMQQLATEGAVEVVPNRGFRVVERGARELAELAEIRGLIEAPVMLRLARTLPADDWEDLRPLAEETARAAAVGCRATYAEADRAFHRAILDLAGNEQLVRIADELHRRAQWPLGGSPTARARLELMADAAQHLALLDALSAQDLSAVEALLREHFVSM
ncbi:GntR family transcriptional regulator [Streptomyces umbrinus]|uniref:GntR family transcriptional regulator n=1 Tax=Streptomyces umbrinus TaxID=67370 RepID=UPI003592ECD0